MKARKSSPCTLKLAQILPFCACRANFFAEMPLEGRCWAKFFAPSGPAPVLEATRRTSGWWRWGFCAMRSPLAACHRRVAPLHGAIPPIGGGAARVCEGAAAKVQTHWVKNGEKSLLWLNESTFWQIRPLAWRGIRTRATPPPLRSNVARNSPMTASKAELPSLELQRLQAISKSDRIKLCATFERGHP